MLSVFARFECQPSFVPVNFMFQLFISKYMKKSMLTWIVGVSMCGPEFPSPVHVFFIVPSHGDVSVRKSSLVHQDAVFLPP
jgi:hypothetical protein